MGVSRNDILKVVEMCRQYGATRVVLFGSCVYKSPEEANDIDILCYGVPAEKWVDLYSDIEFGIDSPVDLLSAAQCDQELRNYWEGYGIMLFDSCQRYISSDLNKKHRGHPHKATL